jgi:outer membrane protein TolC
MRNRCAAKHHEVRGRKSFARGTTHAERARVNHARAAACGFVLAASLTTEPVFADTAMDAYVTEVLSRNPTVHAGALRRDAFRSEAVAAGKWPDPSVAVMVDRVPDRGVEMPMVRYQLTQMVPWPGKLGFMQSAVEQQEQGAAASLDVRKLDLRLQAKRGYTMLGLNAKRREINRANRNLSATIASAALGRYGSGAGGHHEVARAQVEVSALDVTFVNLEGERTSVVAMLNALRDRPIDTAIADPQVQASAEVDYAMTPLVERAIAQRPELKGMRAMESEALAMASLARREKYPDLMGSVWMNQMLGGPATVGVMIGGTIPVFGLSRQEHRAAAADARAEGAAYDQAAMRAMIRFEVADALVRVQTTTRQLDLVRTVALPKARESFDASLAGFGASTVDMVGVIDARRALQQAELAQAEAVVAREIALAELERAVGGPLGGATR